MHCVNQNKDIVPSQTYFIVTGIFGFVFIKKVIIVRFYKAVYIKLIQTIEQELNV